MTVAIRKTDLQLGQRDLGVLRSIGECLCLSTSQIGLLHFPSAKKASERLKSLAEAGLLKPAKRTWQFAQPKTEYFHTVTAAGREVLGRSGQLFGAGITAARPSPSLNLDHLAAINQFLILTQVACGSSAGFHASCVRSWEISASAAPNASAEARGILGKALRPDATIWLSNPAGKGLLLFLEIDRGTEPLSRRQNSPQTSLEAKFEVYCRCFDAGDFRPVALHLFRGSPRGFRVLLVTTAHSRIEALRERLQEQGDTRFVWATTFAELEAGGVFGRIWQIVSPDAEGRRSFIEPYRHPQLPAGSSP